jgi:hypothetical protein
LTVGPVAKRLGDSVVRMLGYNGSIPGPTLKVGQGSEIIVHVQNQGDLDTTVHWHGLRLENRYDGVPHETQAPIPVGGEFTYRIQFPDPGLYWYHPHIREDYTQELGLYGNLLVVPSDPDYWPDRVRLGSGARLGAVPLAATDQHRGRPDRPSTTDVGVQVVVGRAVAGIGHQDVGDWLARPGQEPGQQLAHPVGGHGQHPRLVGGPEQAARDRDRGDQLVLGGLQAEPGQAVGEPGRGDRVGVGGEAHRQALVAQPPHRLGGAGHDPAAHVQGAVQVQQHGPDPAQPPHDPPHPAGAGQRS